MQASGLSTGCCMLHVVVQATRHRSLRWLLQVPLSNNILFTGWLAGHATHRMLPWGFRVGGSIQGLSVCVRPDATTDTAVPSCHCGFLDAVPATPAAAMAGRSCHALEARWIPWNPNILRLPKCCLGGARYWRTIVVFWILVPAVQLRVASAAATAGICPKGMLTVPWLNCHACKWGVCAARGAASRGLSCCTVHSHQRWFGEVWGILAGCVYPPGCTRAMSPDASQTAAAAEKAAHRCIYFAVGFGSA